MGLSENGKAHTRLFFSFKWFFPQADIGQVVYYSIPPISAFGVHQPPLLIFCVWFYYKNFCLKLYSHYCSQSSSMQIIILFNATFRNSCVEAAYLGVNLLCFKTTSAVTERELTSHEILSKVVGYSAWYWLRYVIHVANFARRIPKQETPWESFVDRQLCAFWRV